MSELLIVNASPLVFLGNAGRLELLRALGSAGIRVPMVVMREVTQSAHLDRASISVAKAPWIAPLEELAVPESVARWGLDPGEEQVVTAGLTNRSARVVIDDLAGRKCAIAHNLDVIGTLGVVVAAHRRGLVGDPAVVFEELRGAGMWLSDSVLARALELAKQ